jgi:hypothetical protein
MTASWLCLLLSCLAGDPAQYILFNRTPGMAFNQARPQSISPQGLADITNHFPVSPDSRRRVGVAFIFSYLNTPDTDTLESLRGFLDAAGQTRTPVLIKLDGESWWSATPELWNWWDPARPGYDPANRANVEWTGWSQDNAIRIAWRNWGSQIRILPPPNLFSPKYRKACHDKMALMLPIILNWWQSLPPDQKDLLVGINVGWESSIGVNAWYYPGGNDLLDQPASKDPQTGLKTDDVLARGQVQIGYASVRSAGIRSSGAITEDDLCEVVRRHLEDLSRVVAEAGFPRDRIFTHSAGWKDGERLYSTALNRYSCPGWSFYRYAGNPAGDRGVQSVLRKSDAPFWAAAEWLLQKPDDTAVWKSAIEKSLADPKCRFICIYNWEGVAGKPAVLDAVRQVCGGK